MKWAVGVLTWNRHERCRETLRHLEAHLIGDRELRVFDNGSVPPFAANGHRVIRHDENLGAGGGLSALMCAVLAEAPDAVLFLEDDWTLERPLDLADLEELLELPDVGQIRLAVRSRFPAERYWTYALEGEAASASAAQAAKPFHSFGGGDYQRVRLLWSNNPFACSAEVARRFLLTGLDEIRMARPYLASDLWTVDTIPGYFRHAGSIRERRGEPGWKR